MKMDSENKKGKSIDDILAETATVGRRQKDKSKAKRFDEKFSLWDKLDEEDHDLENFDDSSIKPHINNFHSEFNQQAIEENQENNQNKFENNLSNEKEDIAEELPERNFELIADDKQTEELSDFCDENIVLVEEDNDDFDEEFDKPEPSLEMAELYEKQELYYEALEIYKEILENNKSKDIEDAVQRVLDKIFVFDSTGYSELMNKIFSADELKKFLILPAYQYSKMQQVLGKQEQDSAPLNLTVTLKEKKTSSPMNDMMPEQSKVTVGEFAKYLVKLAGENKKLASLTLGELLQAAKILEE